MNFSGIVFLYFFLPLFFGIYAISKPFMRAYVMLLGSCAVIAWESPLGLIPFSCSVLIAYLGGLGCKKLKNNKKAATALLTVCILPEIAVPILVFVIGASEIGIMTTVGAGIYTLHSISYCCDVFRGECEAVTDPLRLAAYVSFLPSLDGIPLVEPKKTLEAMKEPKLNSEMLADGILLMLFGTIEKVLISDRLAMLFTEMQETSGGELSMIMSWVGAFFFGSAMLCRLKGYAHIAQGFAMMLGFDIGPSFDYPYSKSSLKDYLASYNISAYRFVQKNVYRPIAGSESNHARTLTASTISIITVCISYKPSIPFLLWGTGAALLITIELLADHQLSKIPRPVRYILTHSLTLIGWGIISQKTAVASFGYVSRMFTGALNLDAAPLLYFLSSAGPFVMLLLFFEAKTFITMLKRVSARKVNPIMFIKPFLVFALLVICTAFLLSGGQTASRWEVPIG